MFAPRSLYDDAAPYELVIFDLRIPAAVERYWSERTAWAEAANVEALDEDHTILIVRPDGARGLLA